MKHYLMDLVASSVVVLGVGWFVQASASEPYVRNALITQNEVYVAINRFTPHNLLASYAATDEHLVRSITADHDFTGGLDAAARHTVVTTVVLTFNLTAA